MLRERFAEPSTRTPPASPMNNDGHAAALNRAALMSLLMGRHRWFVALGGFFFAGRAPPGPVSPSLPSGWQARPGGAGHGGAAALRGWRRFGEDLFLAHARARARGRATRRAASPRTLRAHKRCAHGQARPAARTSCGGAVSGSDPSAQRRRRPVPTPSAAQLNPLTVGCELPLTASRPPERV